VAPRRRTLAALVVALAALLASAPSAETGRTLVVGVGDDWVKWRADTAGIVRLQREAGFETAKVSFPWRPGMWHAGRTERFYVQRLAKMAALGQHVVVAFSGAADDAPRTYATREQFCSYVRSVVAQLPVFDVVIWNEANSPAFWRPQRDAPAGYAALLGRCWDVLHDMRPGINVLSSTAPRHAPLAFLRELGVAYAASGRTRPIVDTFGHNPYPLNAREPPTAVHDDGYVGQGDYSALVETLRNAFAGTAQPVDAVWYLETGFQTAAPFRGSLYHGFETETSPLAAVEQARQLGDALKLAYCTQPLVGAFFNFQLADERRLGGWQSGLLWANWQPKPSREPVRELIGAIRSRTLACV
jgi:hypothetical protein